MEYFDSDFVISLDRDQRRSTPQASSYTAILYSNPQVVCLLDVQNAILQASSLLFVNN